MLEEQCSELKRQLAEKNAKYDHLLNQFVWRATKLPLDPETLPADYLETLIPKKEVDTAQVLTDPKEKAEPVLSPRARLKQAEESRQREFEKEMGIHEVKEA